ncbi:MAG: hypothetical protein QM778_02945 [Myxococcales bacterium]
MRKSFVFFAISALLGVSSATSVAAAPSARVDCEVQENGQPALGSFRVMSGETQIAKGSCGRAQEVPPGGYDLQITLDGAIDAPTSKQRVEARVGELTKARASFETGEILVELTRDGRRTVGTIRLLRGKDVIATLTAGVTSRVSAGTYSVEIESRGTRRVLDAITISRAERRSLSADFSASGAQASP